MTKSAIIVPAKNRHGIEWQKSRSPHGHLIAEVLSAVIKEIRRSKEEESLYWALEMALCGRTAEEFLWECLIVFTSEDVGLFDDSALQVIRELKDGYFLIPEKDHRRFIFLAHAVSYLARAKKSRYVAELLGDIIARRDSGEMNLEVPDYAIDIHTERGKAMGRDKEHYLLEASLIHNGEIPKPDYFSRLVARARTK